MNKEILAFFIVIFIIYITLRFINRTGFPILINMLTKELDKNPKWITSKLKNNYYGFEDIDFITAECSMRALPRFRVSKSNPHRLEFLVPNDASVDDVELLGKLALMGKLKLKYGLFISDEPLDWLSKMCFILDNKNVIKEMKILDKKPIDDFDDM